MSRILRHISAKDLKRTHQKKLSEQKKLIAQKLKEWQEAEKERRQIEEAARPYKSNWREELNEGMTTQDMSYISTLAGEGDTALDAAIGWSGTGGSSSGSTLVVNAGGIQLSGGGSFQQATITAKEMDVTKFDTARVTVTKTFDAGDETDIRIFSNYFSNPNQFFLNAFFDDNYYPLSGGTGVREFAVGMNTHADKFKFQVRSAKRKAFDSESGLHVDAPTSRYTVKIELLRKNPMTVFVPLDSPEASSFVRDGDFDRLTPAQKKKKLEEQLAASKEYLDKMFGEGMPGTATQIADIQPQQSFMDIALDTIPYEEPSPGPGGYKPPGSYDPNKFYDLKTDPSQLPSPNLPDTGPGRSSAPNKDTQVARINDQPGDSPAQIKWPRNYFPNKKAPPGPGYKPPVKKAKKQTTMVAHHEPQGKVLSEKKRLKSPKDLVDKIPGYYDGKPSPLGFPVEEPPKMKNGYHPDLVDGKKVAKRYNRLDPISAKAMPPTGNPHIDKKVRAAAKKSK
mgnify:CR=1 FL=1